jgi:glucose/arabinose dehydrogenase
MRKLKTSAYLVMLLLAGLPMLFAATLAKAQAYSYQTVAEGIAYPWRIAFLPDARMLVTSREGRLWLLSADGKDKQEVSGVPPVLAQGQGGLFEALPHPDFAANGLVYLTYAHGTTDENATRVARARLNGTALENLEVLFTAEPFKAGPAHFGGRMVFLPDGTFLLTTGDGFNYREEAQKLDNHLGKIVRLNADGTVPQDNPFVKQADARPEIWSYGHRNPQGIAYNAATSRVYANEHGPAGGDEINIIEPGRNYGWPIATRGRDYSGAMISPFKSYAGMADPLVDWTPSIAPSALQIYWGDMFPGWQGDLLTSALVSRDVRRVRISGDQVAEQESVFADVGERLRDVRVGPDGAIYLATDTPNGRIIRVTPAKRQAASGALPR